MPRFQFHLSDLLIGLTLFAVGLGSMAIAMGKSYIPDPPDVVVLYFALSSPMLIGAAIGAPFQKKAMGATVGFVIGLIALIGMVCLAYVVLNGLNGV